MMSLDEMLDTIREAGYPCIWSGTVRLYGEYSKRDLLLIIELLDKGHSDD
jgi:hypothetical protein